MCLLAIIAFTVRVMLPIYYAVLDESLDVESPRVDALFRRWAKLHWLRVALNALAFVMALGLTST